MQKNSGEKRIWERVAVFCFAALCLVIILGNVLFVWAATGPRQISFITPYVERALMPKDNSYKITIKESLLAWEGWRHPLNLRVRGVSVESEGSVFARFPELSVGINLIALSVGRLEPRSLEIRNADIVLRRDEEGNIRFVLEDNQQETKPLSLAGLIKNDSGSDTSASIEEVAIRNAKVTLLGPAGEKLGQVPSLTFGIKRNKQGYKGNLQLELTEGAAHTYLHVGAQWYAADKSSALTAELRDFNPKLISLLLPGQPMLKGIDLPVSGKISAAISKDNSLSKIEFDITSGAGHITYAKEFSDTLDIKKCSAKGYLKDNLQSITLQSSLCDFGNPAISAHGYVHLDGDHTEAHIVGEAKALPTDEIVKYWPFSLAPETRHWVTSRISKGHVPEANITLNILPGDILLPSLPEQSLRAWLRTSGISVRYKPSHPTVEEIDSTVTATGKTLHVEASSASALTGTKLKKGTIHIEDMNLENPDILLDLDLSAPIKDAVAFLSLPDIKLAQKANLDSSATGAVDANIKLSLKMYDDRGQDADKVAATVAAKLMDITQQKLLGKYDIVGFTGELQATNSKLSVKGTGNANGVAVNDLDASLDFSGKEDETTVKATALNMGVPAFSRFGIKAPPQLRGNTDVTLDYREKGRFYTAKILLDLLNSDLQVTELAHHKPKAVAGTLSAQIEQNQGEATRIPNFDYNTQGMSAHGSAILNSQGELQAIRFDKMQQGNSKLALAYGKENGKMRLELKGDSFDFSNRVGQNGTFSTQDWHDLDVQAEIKHVILKEGRELSNVKAMLSCGPKQCQRGLFTGYVGGKSFNFSLETQGGNRRLSGKADDAGSLLKALGIYSNMEGGQLTIEAKGPLGKKLEGIMRIGKHSARNAPALTKLLTVASLTGIVDSLRGEGISFTELTAPFSFIDDVILLTDTKDYGAALGLTADGTLNLRKGQMDLTGTIVPSYTLNSLVEKVPLIGTVITGGKGQGIFATRYSMRGPMGDPVINLNPLSMLTPGFTRNIFNIFNRPAPKESDVVPIGKTSASANDNITIPPADNVNNRVLPPKKIRN